MRHWLFLAILWVAHVVYTEVTVERMTTVTINKTITTAIWAKFQNTMQCLAERKKEIDEATKPHDPGARPDKIQSMTITSPAHPSD